jgi:hydrogenase-4 component B
MPYTAMLFLIGSISIPALPPFNGFVSELMIFEVFFKSTLISSPLIEAILFISLSLLAMTSALAAACFVKAFAIVFLAVPRSEEAAHAKEAPKSMIIGPAILAAFCALLGIFSFQIFFFIGKRTGYNFPVPNLLWVSLALLICGALTVIAVRIFASKQSRVSETWGCGILSQNSRMEYTASGFSEPIINIFKFVYRTKKINEREFNDNHQADFKAGRAEIKLLKFFDEYLYLPIAQLIRRISLFLYHLQNKVELDSYILYSFLAILALVAVVGWVI